MASTHAQGVIALAADHGQSTFSSSSEDFVVASVAVHRVGAAEHAAIEIDGVVALVAADGGRGHLSRNGDGVIALATHDAAAGQLVSSPGTSFFVGEDADGKGVVASVTVNGAAVDVGNVDGVVVFVALDCAAQLNQAIFNSDDVFTGATQQAVAEADGQASEVCVVIACCDDGDFVITFRNANFSSGDVFAVGEDFNSVIASGEVNTQAVHTAAHGQLVGEV